MSSVIILLGANLGNKLLTLNKAVELIIKYIGDIDLISDIYETAAWGKENQPSYYNQTIKVSTNISPQELILITQQIENELGRIRKEKWGARIIDVDILFYDNDIIETENLIVPHPYIQDRRFTLEPLTEIIPKYIHPVLNLSISELLLQCKDPLSVKRLQKVMD
ncbi:2-amino-4-hydroxy-6-hydroxymethyldihydropteridine diphosphokinase [Flammeovirga pacifica]|uniref:2-amino-4-hydroxy-6-hydroxymethyldihydropteridine pyrophosphokinase n=1 Tax=Flammeovirga pacifica TaxID=915059 RepID=A0A1S1YXB7_FLAPC|nr:2-amino-4-hydroxy-6-hydroxymethyldihydropteridine diphosphokinase [Flammeovirga pacifica]OHX65495.1 2-amino-4-hydroxy-6-hydroxymethyldihydropteridine diphosphokinase [Flammeovirga pacifica]